MHHGHARFCFAASDIPAESRPTKLREISEMTISPPPGFPQFQWPQADWILEGEPSIDPGLKEGSQDSMMVQVGSPVVATPKPAGLDQVRSTHRGRPRRPIKHELRREKPAPVEDFLFKNILRAPAMGTARKLTETTTRIVHHGGALPEKGRL